MRTNAGSYREKCPGAAGERDDGYLGRPIHSRHHRGPVWLRVLSSRESIISTPCRCGTIFLRPEFCGVLRCQEGVFVWILACLMSVVASVCCGFGLLVFLDCEDNELIRFCCTPQPPNPEEKRQTPDPTTFAPILSVAFDTFAAGFWRLW